MQSPPLEPLFPAMGWLIRRRRLSHALPTSSSALRQGARSHPHKRGAITRAVGCSSPPAPPSILSQPQASVPRSSHEPLSVVRQGAPSPCISVVRSPALSGDSSPPAPQVPFHSHLAGDAPSHPFPLAEKLHSQIFKPKHKKRKPDLLRDQA